MAYEAYLLLSGKPAPWTIIGPDLTAIYNARKKNKKATLEIRLEWIEQTIKLSDVRIRKHEKKGGRTGYQIEEWFFSAWIIINGNGMGRGRGKLWFKDGRLTGEISGPIVVSMSALSSPL